MLAKSVESAMKNTTNTTYLIMNIVKFCYIPKSPELQNRKSRSLQLSVSDYVQILKRRKPPSFPTSKLQSAEKMHIQNPPRDHTRDDFAALKHENQCNS